MKTYNDWDCRLGFLVVSARDLQAKGYEFKSQLGREKLSNHSYI